MAAPTVLAIKVHPVQRALSRILRLRGRAIDAVLPVVGSKLGNQVGTVAASKSIFAARANYTRAITLYASSLDGSALPAWLTQDYASNILTLTKAAGAGVAGTYSLRIVAQDAAGYSVFDRFLLTLT